MLNTTSKPLALGIAIGLSLSTAAAWGSPATTRTAQLVGTARIAQAPDDRARYDDLLRRAQQAMDQRDLDTADYYLSEAESLNIRHTLFDTGPTAKKLRTQLEELAARNRAGGEAQFARFDELFDERSGGSAERTAGESDNARQTAAFFLDQGRRALEQGDMPAAEHYHRKAVETGAQFGPNEYSPARLAADILAAGGRISNSAAASGADSLGSSRRGAVGAVPGPLTSEREPQRLPAGVDEAARLVSQARAALDRGDLAQAERLARQADALGVSDSAYGHNQDRPGLVLLDVQQARRQSEAPGGLGRDDRFAVQPGLYERERDRTRVVAAQAEVDSGPGRAQKLFDRGVQALRDGDRDQARELFRQAWELRSELDPATAQRVKDHLQVLAVRPAGRGEPELIDTPEQAHARKILTEAAHIERDARRQMEHDPRASLEMLRDAHTMVANAPIDPAGKEQTLRRIEKTLAEVEQYYREHRSELETRDRARDVKTQVDRRQQNRIEINDQLHQLTKEFNDLLRQKRFMEAKVLAAKAEKLDPDNPVVQLMVWKAEFVREHQNQLAIAQQKRAGVMAAFDSVAMSSIPFDDNQPYQLPENWNDLLKRRDRYGREGRERRTEKEMEIEQKLKTLVMAVFNERPLLEVIHELARQADVPVHIDPRGLSEEGINPSDQLVSINISQPISLRSALNHVLGPLNLGFVIKDEVLKVTSQVRRGGEVFQVVYPVADLVIRIPNFVPTARMGLSGALQEAHDRLGNVQPGFGSPMAMTMAGAEANSSGATINSGLLAQMGATGGVPGRGAPLMVGGPGGLGGGAQADFQSIIDLVTSTVSPASWDAMGGQGSIKEFETNLTLVISQTQEVHDEIVDLLEQLRRLQDLQVTIEVKFITLSDTFFERIGIDFDFDINDKTRVNALNIANDRPTVQLGAPGTPGSVLIPNNPGTPGSGSGGPSVTVGIGGPTLGPFPTYTADLDLQFRNGSFVETLPTLGMIATRHGAPVAFDPANAASFGFAILSDIEAFFFLQAAQADVRTNILQAPKVTLFNGQQAFVSDTAMRPFVTSLIPVVGDFATAHQPVVVVLSEGTALTIQAVVSNDRRFVRLTVIPFFSKVGPVDTFTFSGKETTIFGSSASSSVGADEQSDALAVDRTVIREGATVQLPTFEFVTVSTTVSVPDGGTVLLGGVKRLGEERREFGVPILSKVRYINRLFKNVGISRETSSLMMMVTPRIIIQEEEEARLVGGGA